MTEQRKQWSHLEQDVQDQLAWFEDHILDADLSAREAAEAIGYDVSNISRIRRGEYSGSWANVARAIKDYRRLSEQRARIRGAKLVKNGISEMIHAGMQYAISNNSITTITGESRTGKTAAAEMYRDANRGTVLVTAPPFCGVPLLVRRLAAAVGVRKARTQVEMLDGITDAFGPSRMLIIDQAHRLLPANRNGNPLALEILMDLHDETGCGLALIATERFEHELRKDRSYQYEQILGRIDMPIKLPERLLRADWMPILEQYIPAPSAEMRKLAGRIANAEGRLAVLVKVLKVAARIAAKQGVAIGDDHVHRAVKLRRQMMGEANQ